jgi:hypothetical protein
VVNRTINTSSNPLFTYRLWYRAWSAPWPGTTNCPRESTDWYWMPHAQCWRRTNQSSQTGTASTSAILSPCYRSSKAGSEIPSAAWTHHSLSRSWMFGTLSSDPWLTPRSDRIYHL